MNLIQRASRRKLVLIAAATLCLGAADAQAATGTGHGSFTDLIPYWINFVLYLVIIYFLTRKLLAKAWAERRQRIIDDISSARQQYSHAESLLADAQAKWGRLSQEETRVRDEVARQGEYERQQMLEAARAKAARTVAQAKEHGDAERRSAERLIREELVADVMSRASRILKETATHDADRDFRASAVSAANRLVN